MRLPNRSTWIVLSFLVFAMASQGMFADTCSTRHFYNNSVYTWTLTMGGGSCSYDDVNGIHHEKDKTCVISPRSRKTSGVAEIFYPNSTAEQFWIQAPQIFDPYNQSAEHWTTDNLPACNITHNGDTTFESLNAPPNGDITPCPDTCGVGLAASPAQTAGGNNLKCMTSGSTVNPLSIGPI